MNFFQNIFTVNSLILNCYYFTWNYFSIVSAFATFIKIVSLYNLTNPHSNLISKMIKKFNKLNWIQCNVNSTLIWATKKQIFKTSSQTTIDSFVKINSSSASLQVSVVALCLRWMSSAFSDRSPLEKPSTCLFHAFSHWFLAFMFIWDASIIIYRLLYTYIFIYLDLKKEIGHKVWYKWEVKVKYNIIYIRIDILAFN